MQLNPQSVLDVGCGFGKYGMLAREYLEYWGAGAALNWKRKIDAVEGFANYITPLHHYIYNTIYVKNVLIIIDKLKGYDLVLLIDVLEHFDKPQGETLVESLISHNKGILISTPKVFAEQGDTFGNEYERHKTVWTEQELKSLGQVLFIPDERSIICHIQKLQ
jgi:2-polyprenyl-3-methyl-5-hydroxy-6-metoxy-1,4-benzoquinol methylase